MTEPVSAELRVYCICKTGAEPEGRDPACRMHGAPLGETARHSFLCVRCRDFKPYAEAHDRWTTVEHYQRGICRGCKSVQEAPDA